MKKYKPYLGRVDLVKNQVAREELKEQEAKRKRSARVQQQNKQRWLKYQEQLRSELAARYFHAVQSTGGESFSNTKSMNFDGTDDYVNVGTSSLGITSAITVSAWVKIPTTNTGGGGANIQVIACEDTTSGGQRNWNMFWRGTGFNYFAWAIHHTNLSFSSVTTTGITPNDGQWHHLLGTYDGTTNANGIKLYIDGGTPFTATAASTGINAFSSSEPTIGALTGGGSWRFEGNIDEVAVWNSDRNADASTIYNGGVPNNLTSLSPLSWWRFEGTGATATDSGTGGNDGTINGATRDTDTPG